MQKLMTGIGGLHVAEGSSCSIRSQYSDLHSVYDVEDPAIDALFPGKGYINYGYWKDLVQPGCQITEAERILSQERLYRLVLESLDICKEDSLLEIGCGRGLGCILATDLYCLRQVVGVDKIPEQIDRAKSRSAQRHISDLVLMFHVGEAECLPFPSSFFTKALLLEAIQHFVDISKFCKELYRILQTNGQAAISSFFATDRSAMPELLELIPTLRENIDRVRPVQDVFQALIEVGFYFDNVKTIGNYTFEGYDQWVAQTIFCNSWSRNWMTAYERGLIDYYAIKVKKLSRSSASVAFFNSFEKGEFDDHLPC